MTEMPEAGVALAVSAVAGMQIEHRSVYSLLPSLLCICGQPDGIDVELVPLLLECICRTLDIRLDLLRVGAT